METAIKKPTKGERIRSEELSITAKVVDILSYDEAMSSLRLDERLQINRGLAEELGGDYRNKYFECFVKVTYAKKDSEYKRGEIVVISWKDYQKCTNLNY